MRRILLLLQLPSALMVLYLDVLSVAAVFWRRDPPAALPQNRFAVLVPAHNEELLLPRLLESLASLQYPPDLYDVHVVADNCRDGTAVVAAAGRAVVHERRDMDLPGKGYAIRWLLSRVRREGVYYDAYVVLDADCVVSPNFLDVMNRHMVRGDHAVQSYYGVSNAMESWSSAVRYAALALFNGLRPRGRDALGLSAGLRGSGMCFSTDVVDRFGWEAFTLAEDVELHLQLVEAGVRVTYAGEARVLAEMPISLGQARSQNVRWERGRLQMLRVFGPRLLSEGIRRRDPAQIEALIEQLVPPLSVLMGVTTLSYVLTVALRVSMPRRLASCVLLGQLGYVLTGLSLVRAQPRIYIALLGAPFYILWKIWIYVIAASHLSDGRWIRTARTMDDKSGQ